MRFEGSQMLHSNDYTYEIIPVPPRDLLSKPHRAMSLDPTWSPTAVL